MEVADDISLGQRIVPTEYKPKTLQEEICRRGRLPLTECLEIGSALAAALAYLHSHGLVHRDIKSSNIVFVEGVPKLVDIGLVTAAGGQTLVGTIGYIPPEGPGTPRADIFSLGKVIYEMATGKPATDFPSLPTANEPEDYKVFAALNEILTKACEPDHRRRYQAALDLGDDLKRLRRGQKPAKANSKRRRFLFGMGLGLLVVLAGVFLIIKWRQGREFGWSSVSKITHPSVHDWAGALLGDSNHDGRDDIFVTTSNLLLVLSLDGKTLGSWSPPSRSADNLGIDLLRDQTVASFSLRGSHVEHQQELILSWRDDLTNLYVSAHDEKLSVVRRFSELGTITNGEPRSTFVALDVLDQDGHKGLLAKIFTGYGARPRGIRYFDFETQRLAWPFDTAAAVSDVIYVGPGDERSAEIVFGTYAPDNHAKLDDTDDAHSYIYGISRKGELRWRHETGGVFSRCEVRVADFGDGANKQIIAGIRSGYGIRRNLTGVGRFDSKTNLIATAERGLLEKYDLAGNLLTNYDLGWLLTSFRTAVLESNGSSQVLATDRSGILHILDSNLHLTKKVSVVPLRPDCDWINLHLEDVADLDGDGSVELVFSSGQEKFISGEGPGRPTDERLRRDWLDNSVLVFGQDLELRAKYVISPRWKDQHGFKVLVTGPGPNGRRRLLALADRAVLLDLAPAPRKQTP